VPVILSALVSRIKPPGIILEKVVSPVRESKQRVIFCIGDLDLEFTISTASKNPKFTFYFNLKRIPT
jgi:hypothetical protein